MTEHWPSTLTIAKRLLALGLSVFPVPRPGAGYDGKTPVIKWKAYQQRLPTVAALEEWFATPRNIAVATGQLSGVVVVDVDNGDAVAWAHQHLPDTPWKTLTGKGVHLWYQHPGELVPNRSRLTTDAGRLALDVRGDGGYVLAPGSLHATGTWYRPVGDWHIPRDRLPRFALDWLPPSIDRSRDVSKQEGARPRELPPLRAKALTRARAYLAATPRPEIGCGSDAATFTAACRLVRGFDISPIDAEALLWQWCGNRPGWTRAWVAQKVRNADKHGAEPIGARL